MTAALKNRPTVAQERSVVYTAILCFSDTPRCAEQNHKKYQNFISPFVISKPSPSARHAHQAPLAHSDPSRHEASDAQTTPAASCSTTAHGNFATFIENSPLFAQNAPLSDPLPRVRHDTRRRTPASVDRHFLPSPFTSRSTPLIIWKLKVNTAGIFCFTEVKADEVKPSPLSLYISITCGRKVKR